MATGPTQSAPMPASKRGTIDGELIPFENLTVAGGTTEDSAWFDVGPGLFIASLVIEIASSADSLEFRIAWADDTSGTNQEAGEKLNIDSGDTGRYEMQFSNQVKVGGDLITKRAFRVTADPGAAGTVVVTIAYVAKAKVN